MNEVVSKTYTDFKKLNTRVYRFNAQLIDKIVESNSHDELIWNIQSLFGVKDKSKLIKMIDFSSDIMNHDIDQTILFILKFMELYGE